MPNDDPKVSLSERALESMLTRVLEEARKPYVDEDEVARKKAAHDQLVASAKERRAREQRRRDRCQHKRRSPLGVLSYKIAWQQNSDGKFRGVCQICGQQFTPERTATDRYRELVRESLDPTTAAYAVQMGA